LDSFAIDKYEVTNEEYARYLKAAGGKAPWYWPRGEFPEGQARLPVYNVNWDEASAYCKWAGKRLPTEAEWERAARGGLDRKKFPWGDAALGNGGYGAPDVAVESGRGTMAHANYPFGAIAVGSFQPNGYGLFHMAGNGQE